MRGKRFYIKVLCILILVIFALVFAYRFELFKGFSINSVEDFINSYGKFAAIIYILIFAARTLLVVFPVSILVVLGGSIFGPICGFLYSMVAIFISASLAFFLSRYLGKSFVQRILKNRADKVDLKIEQHGFKIIFFMRISMVFPYDIMNFAAGLTKVKYKEFILGTLLGIAPEVFALNYLGDNIRNPVWWHFAISALLIVVTVAVPLISKRRKQVK